MRGFAPIRRGFGRTRFLFREQFSPPWPVSLLESNKPRAEMVTDCAQMYADPSYSSSPEGRGVRGRGVTQSAPISRNLCLDDAFWADSTAASPNLQILIGSGAFDRCGHFPCL